MAVDVERLPATRRTRSWVAWVALVVALLALGLGIANRVMASSPPAQSPVVKVPFVDGRSLQQAQTELSQAGLKLGKVTHLTIRAVPQGVVAWQEPIPATKLKRGSTVDLVVSDGPVSSGPVTCVELGGRSTCGNSWGGQAPATG